jgi:hypothetical protein
MREQATLEYVLLAFSIAIVVLGILLNFAAFPA